jgi:DNA polymerase-3 subunit gamma/tau
MAGLMGSGKTSAARILAAMENCEHGPTMEPCGKCKNCVEIFKGESLDVKEMDAASQRGIDDIRDLKKELNYSPLSCRSIYVIIDEVHSLSSAAAESLLKVIEEPPPRVRFILATTDPQMLRPAIHSRCITLTFPKISWVTLYEHLKRISALEGFKIDDPALKLISRRSKGSVRNSLQNLQSVVDFAGDELANLEMAEKVLGVVDDSFYFKYMDAILAKDIAQTIKSINDIVIKGRKSDEILGGLEEHLRNLNLVNCCQGNVQEFGFTEDEVKRYVHQGKIAKPQLVCEMLDLLIDVHRSVNLNLDIQTYLENMSIKSIILLVKLEKQAKK